MSDSAHFAIPDGAPAKSCSSCARTIYWVRTPKGRACPVDPDGTNHFITCPSSERHRKKASLRRAAACERAGAKILKTTRHIRRSRYEPGPDNAPVHLKSGDTIQPESKSRDELPKWLTEPLDQARRYNPTATPLVYWFAPGAEPIAVLPLRDFARLVGITEPRIGEQLSLGELAK